MEEKAVVEIFPLVEHLGYWGFTVTYRGVTYRYSGVPNYCHSAHSARMRGWWRKRWFENGTHDQHYR